MNLAFTHAHTHMIIDTIDCLFMVIVVVTGLIMMLLLFPQTLTVCGTVLNLFLPRWRLDQSERSTIFFFDPFIFISIHSGYLLLVPHLCIHLALDVRTSLYTCPNVRVRTRVDGISTSALNRYNFSLTACLWVSQWIMAVVVWCIAPSDSPSPHLCIS